MYWRLSPALSSLLLSILVLGSASAQPLTVTSVSPSANFVGADRGATISATFNRTLNATTVNNASVRVFGRWSGPASGQLVVNNASLSFIPDEPFFAGEHVTVSISRNVADNAGGTLAHGYQWSYWSSVSGGSFDFVFDSEIPIRENGEGAILAYGAYGGDLDNDGWSDLVIPNEGPSDFRVFLNDGTGDYSNFTIYDMPSSSSPSTNEGADFNGDGEIDIAIGSGAGINISVFMGVGDGTFQNEVAYEGGAPGSWIRGLCVADLDGDGWDDLVATTRDGDSASILLNTGTGTFQTAVPVETNGILETTCASADVNADGIMDFFIGSYSSQTISLMLGDGNGSFTFSDSISVDGFPWMSVAGDLNGDAVPDVITAGFTGRNISVVTASANGMLTSHTSYIAGDAVLAVDLGDIDGDGDLDVVTSNLSSNDFTLFENDGNANLTIYGTLASSSAGSCAIIHDRDNDGDLDITGIDEADDVVLLYVNPNELSVEGLHLSSVINNNEVSLFWSTVSETNNLGFDVQRQAGRAAEASPELWETIAFVAGANNSVDTKYYSARDSSPLPATSTYRLRQVDTDGTYDYSNAIEISFATPNRLVVEAPYPNPFDDRATISIESGIEQNLLVTLVDLTGRTTSVLADESWSPGLRKEIIIHSESLPSGMYFVKVKGRDTIRIVPVTIAR